MYMYINELVNHLILVDPLSQLDQIQQRLFPILGQNIRGEFSPQAVTDVLVVAGHEDSIGVQDRRRLFVATAIVLEFGESIQNRNRLIWIVL